MMSRRAAYLSVLACVLVAGLAVGGGTGETQDRSNRTDSLPFSQPASDGPVLVAEKTPSKWNVGQQLVQGMPWGSENVPLQQLQANVKESEATPDQRLVMALRDLAGWYRGQRQYDEAEKVYKRILDVQNGRLGGGKHSDISYPYNDLGVLYTETGKYAQAEEALKQALTQWQNYYDAPLRTEDEAVVYHNYSVLLEKAGRANEAKEMEGKAEAIMAARKKALGL